MATPTFKSLFEEEYLRRFGTGKKRTGNEKKAIIRVKKLKRANFKASLHHAFREQPTPNAITERLGWNRVLTGGKSSTQVLKDLETRLKALVPKPRTWIGKNGQEYTEKKGRKIRSDACVAVEVLITGSPEHLAKLGEPMTMDYLRNSLEWLKKKYGRENVIAAGIHRDERNPHLWAYVVPVTSDGRLSAAEVVGNKLQMANLHDNFARLALNYGLERGDRGNGSLHIPARVLYLITEREREELARHAQKQAQSEVDPVRKENEEFRKLLKDPVRLKKLVKQLEDRQYGQGY